jgi:hypothetical protein
MESAIRFSNLFVEIMLAAWFDIALEFFAMFSCLPVTAATMKFHGTRNEPLDCRVYARAAPNQTPPAAQGRRKRGRGSKRVSL